MNVLKLGFKMIYGREISPTTVYISMVNCSVSVPRVRGTTILILRSGS